MDIDPGDVRVSDAEREQVGGRLQRAMSEGRLTLTEFTDRMDAAMAARTRRELDAVVADLPSDLPAVRPGGVPATTDDPVRLKAGIGDLVRRGEWLVPPALHVAVSMGDAKLDFTEARFSAQEITVELKVSVGDVLLVVPEGVTVDVDRVSLSMGSMKNRTGAIPKPGGRHIVVSGKVSMGDLKLVHPRSWKVGPCTVHSPFRITWG